MTPESIDKYMKYDYRSSAESWANGVISVLKGKFYLREQEIDEFRDCMITGRVFSHFRYTADGFLVERWSPKQIFYQRDPDVKWVQDGDYAGRVFFTSKTQAIERYGIFMTEEQKEALYPEYNTGEFDSKNMYGALDTSLYPFSDYRSFKNVTESLGFEPLTGQPFSGQIPRFTDSMASSYMGAKGWMFPQGDMTQITEGYWRGQCRIGKLSLLNPETGEPEIMYVDETFDAKLFGIKEFSNLTFDDEQEVNTIIWTWKTQIWQGVKISTNYSDPTFNENGAAMYINVKPVPFEFKGEFHPLLRPKLPVCGVDFGKMVVDLLKPYQLLYNVLFNQAYELIQRNNGKFLLMDINYLPTLKDWNGEDGAIEKAMTIAKVMGFMPVDSRLQNTQTANFNQNTTVDLDDTPKIERLINLAMLIEQQAFIQIGITPQRQGQIQASETATATNAAVSNSYSITEPYFENFFSYKKRKLQMILDMAQFMETQKEGSDDITLRYTTSDLGEAFIKVTKTEMMTADLGIYADYSAEAYQQLESARRLALENNTTGVPMSSLIKMLKLNSFDDIQATLEDWEEKQQQAEQAKQQQIEEMQKQALAAQAEEKRLDRELKKYEIDTKAATELEKTSLQGISNESSYNPDLDLTDKLIAQKDLALKEQDINSKNYLAQQQLVNQQLDSYRKEKQEKEKIANDNKLKDKEHTLKREVEISKLQQIKTQNASQEKINKEANEAKLKLADKALELKQLEKKMKEMEIANAKTKTNLELGGLEKKVKIEEKLGEVKVKTIKEIADAKIAEQEKLAKVKSKEVVQDTSLKMKENIQQHGFKLKENVEKHKQNLKNIKIKPKIKKK